MFSVVQTIAITPIGIPRGIVVTPDTPTRRPPCGRRQFSVESALSVVIHSRHQVPSVARSATTIEGSDPMFRRLVPLAALCLTPVLSALASAAIIYEPVQSEYGSAPKYYYGGNNPRVFARAERL